MVFLDSGHTIQVSLYISPCWNKTAFCLYVLIEFKKLILSKQCVLRETMLLVGANSERLLLAAEPQEMKKPHSDGFHREVTVQDIASFKNAGKKYISCELLIIVGEQDGRVVKTRAFGSEGLKFDSRQQPLVHLS